MMLFGRLRCAKRNRTPLFTSGVALSLALLMLPLATRANDPKIDLPLRVLIVGGGPDLANNQVAIESNVRYVGKLLPPNTPHTTLFADGNPDRATVLFDDDTRPITDGERVLDILLPASDDAASHYRKPNLGLKLDGASRNADIERVFGQIGQEESINEKNHRLLLYFTGHGSPNQRGFDNNMYDLWAERRTANNREATNLTVRELARQMARIPNEVPIDIVMVQCFSGAFGNLIFEGGDPNGDLIKRDFAGFFATVNNRVAAGCTSAVNEAEYRDFTSFFFAALTGRDRVGRRINGADYNGDGRIGMDEAYCYTLIHDDSIDVPVCTSDVFLRRFVAGEDREIFQTPYNTMLPWATPAQRTALEALSERLKLSGNDRLSTAFEMRGKIDPSGRRPRTEARNAQQRFQSIQNDGRAQVLRLFPDLKLSDPVANKAARTAAVAQLNREAKEGKWKDLFDADEAFDRAMHKIEDQDIADSHLLRFIRLAKSVILAHRLREGNDAGLKTRFARLTEDEGRTVLPPVENLPRDMAVTLPMDKSNRPVSAHYHADCGCEVPKNILANTPL